MMTLREMVHNPFDRSVNDEDIKAPLTSSPSLVIGLWSRSVCFCVDEQKILIQFCYIIMYDDVTILGALSFRTLELSLLVWSFYAIGLIVSALSHFLYEGKS